MKIAVLTKNTLRGNSLSVVEQIIASKGATFINIATDEKKYFDVTQEILLEDCDRILACGNDPANLLVQQKLNKVSEATFETFFSTQNILNRHTTK